jgi:hypothetical protein
MKCETGNMECRNSITAEMIIDAVKSFDMEDINVSVNNKQVEIKPIDIEDATRNCINCLWDDRKTNTCFFGGKCNGDKWQPKSIENKSNNLLVSVHITKTAGHTFNSVLQKIYGRENILYDYSNNRIGGKDPELNNNVPLDTSNYKVVHGHFKATLYDGRRVTWVRNPIYQLLAVFSHSIEKFNYDLKYTEIDLLKFMSDYQGHYRNVTCKYLDGLSLDDFEFIGIAEDFDNSIKRFCDIFDFEYQEKQDRNINKNPEYIEFKNKLSERMINLIKEYSSKDIELYEAVWRRCV